MNRSVWNSKNAIKNKGDNSNQLSFRVKNGDTLDKARAKIVGPGASWRKFLRHIRLEDRPGRFPL